MDKISHHGLLEPLSSLDDGLSKLALIMAALRDPELGCPWDREQSFETIAPYTIEEAYEVADAIARRDFAALKVELGDLLFQVVYHSRLAEETGHFKLRDVVQAIIAKMISRHPHVFGNAPARSAAEQTEAWEAYKAAERARHNRAGILDDVALALPALTRAAKLQARAARVGFDWPGAEPVLEKIAEEARELLHAPAERRVEEFGDLLFALVNLGRHLGIDPEAALRAANDKFVRLFQTMEAKLAAQGLSPADVGLAILEELWQHSKHAEASRAEEKPDA